MLLDLRETVRNSKPIKYSLITLICIPFALVGIGSYFSGGAAAPVATVNGQSIDQQQLERAYQQQRQQLARMFGGQLPEAFANEAALREQALQQLITQQVLESEVVSQIFVMLPGIAFVPNKTPPLFRAIQLNELIGFDALFLISSRHLYRFYHCVI